jgi:DNA-binding HxlR family transcriptional regulator
MEKEADEYCERIFMVIVMNNGKIRFNELHRKLTMCGAKMSKPTLIEHLNHLVKRGIIQRNEEDKQRVSYELNWRELEQLQKAMKINQTALNEIGNEKRFKSKSLIQQEIFTTAMLTIGELFYLKLMILNILEPENKLQNYFSYTLIRKYYNIYATWLLDSCKNSKESSQKILRSIDKSIKTLKETFFETFSDDTQLLTLKNHDVRETLTPNRYAKPTTQTTKQRQRHKRSTD